MDEKKIPYVSTANEEWSPLASQDYIKPLREGRVSIAEQAKRKGELVPLHFSVEQLILCGYDVDPEWKVGWILVESSLSPTGYAMARKVEPKIETLMVKWGLAK